jgi:hypothetical protein
VGANALVDQRGFPLRAAINWSHSCLRTPAVHFMVGQVPSNSIWSYWHPITCYFIFLLCPDLHNVCKCVSWVIYLVAAIGALRWTNRCLCCGCFSAGGALDEASVVQLDLYPIAPGWGAGGVMTCCCGKVRKMIMKRSGKSWGIYRYLQVKKKSVTANLHVLFKQNPATDRFK